MQVYLNGQWQDITGIDLNVGETTTSRIDDVFATKTFTAYLSISQNIPPYTLFRETYYGSSRQWVGSSVITQYLTESDLYVHEFSLLDPSALLKCFLIGIKVYSKESPTWSLDKDKFKSLLKQAERMYPDYTFNFGNSINNRILSSKTYEYGATSTLFDCLNEICVENDVKLKVEFNETTPTQLTIKVKPVVESSYNLMHASLRKTYHTESQDSENYGKYLETYASNVVDRNTITKCDYVQAKADDVLLTDDTAKVFTPTAIENVVDFGIRQFDNALITIKGLNTFFPNHFTLPANKKYGELASTITCTINGETVYFFDYVYEYEIKRYFPNVTKTYFYNTVYFSDADVSWSGTGSITFQIPLSCKGKFTKMNALVEKGQYDALTPQQQASRVFYTIGGNTIENLNGHYKNDIWNIIIGENRGNFITQFQSSSNTMLNNQLEIVYTHGDLLVGMTLLDLVFFVEYNAITNPYIRNEKTVSSYNESDWKPFSRTYGVSSNQIDFDKLYPNMTISNNTLGQIEKVYEVDLTEVTNVDLMFPEAGNAVSLNGVYWYISSCIITQKREKKTAMLTLVKTYQKKASSIGVDTQSESTNNPLHGIVTRPIFLRAIGSYSNTLATNELYMKFTFYNANNNVIFNKKGGNVFYNSLYSRCSIQDDGVGAYLFYCQTMDQIIFDYEKGSGNANVELQPFKYTTSAAEASYVTIELGTMTKDANGTSIFLPSGANGTFDSLISFSKIRIDKDAREKLTFSIIAYHS